jgi:Fic family protein
LREAELMINENILPNNKSIREVYELRNSKEAVKSIIDNTPKLNEKTILEIHEIISRDIDNRLSYRTHDVKIVGSKTKVSPYIYIRDDMKLLLKWYQSVKKELHPLALASLFHMKFEKIHPFSDGNGRVGRVLIVLIMILDNYPPFTIRKNKRKDYLDAFIDQNKIELDESNPLNSKEMFKFLIKEFIETYWSNFLI